MFKGKLIYRTVALFMAVVILLIAAFGVAAVFCVTGIMKILLLLRRTLQYSQDCLILFKLF